MMNGDRIPMKVAHPHFSTNCSYGSFFFFLSTRAISSTFRTKHNFPDAASNNRWLHAAKQNTPQKESVSHAFIKQYLLFLNNNKHQQLRWTAHIHTPYLPCRQRNTAPGRTATCFSDLCISPLSFISLSVPLSLSWTLSVLDVATQFHCEVLPGSAASFFSFCFVSLPIQPFFFSFLRDWPPVFVIRTRVWGRCSTCWRSHCVFLISFFFCLRSAA